MTISAAASPSQVSSSQTTMEPSSNTRATTAASEDRHPQDFMGNLNPANRHNPVTITCLHCKTILGDSSSWFCAIEELDATTFDSLVDVILVEEDKIVERGSYDALSTYREVQCGSAACDRIIGKFYLATPRSLAHIQDKYTLSNSSIRTYEHGARHPSIPATASKEIYNLIRPGPSEVGETLNQLKYMSLVLSDKQQSLAEKVQDVELMSDEHESFKTKLNNLDTLVQSIVETQNKLVQEIRRITNSTTAGLELIPNGSLNHQMKQQQNHHHTSPSEKHIWSDFAPKDRQDALQAQTKLQEARRLQQEHEHDEPELTSRPKTEPRGRKSGQHAPAHKRKPTSPTTIEPPAKRPAVYGEYEEDDDQHGDTEYVEEVPLPLAQLAASNRKARAPKPPALNANGEPIPRRARGRPTKAALAAAAASVAPVEL